MDAQKKMRYFSELILIYFYSQLYFSTHKVYLSKMKLKSCYIRLKMVHYGLGVPVKVLHEAEGHIVTVEASTGELYRGTLIEAEDNMNLQALLI